MVLRHLFGTVALGLIGFAPGVSAAEPGPDACRALAETFSPQQGEISSVDYVENAALATHCDVRGTIDSNIGFAVMLPTEWNGRFVMVGNGGKAGGLEIEDARAHLSDGYATATTDTGHDNTVEGQSGARFGTDPEMEIDFGYRAVHETAETAKG